MNIPNLASRHQAMRASRCSLVSAGWAWSGKQPRRKMAMANAAMIVFLTVFLFLLFQNKTLGLSGFAPLQAHLPYILIGFLDCGASDTQSGTQLQRILAPKKMSPSLDPASLSSTLVRPEFDSTLAISAAPQ